MMNLPLCVKATLEDEGVPWGEGSPEGEGSF
jgi:hypothetical protein